MVQYSNFGRGMETKNHLKNRASSKGFASRVNFILGIIFVIISIMVTTCKKEDEIEKFMREPPPVITVTKVESGLKILWNKVRGAEFYRVEWSDLNFPELHLIWESPPLYVETYYIIENPIVGDGYYRVRAFKCKKLGDCHFNGYSNVVSFDYIP